MDLKSRIGALRRQTGTVAEAPPEPNMGERIARLRARAAGPGAIDDAALAEAFDGEVIARGVVLVETRIPLHEKHGQWPLARLCDPLGALPDAQECDPLRLVYFDTETTGLAGGTGTVAFLLGLARVHADAFVVRQYLLTRFTGEGALLAAAAEWIGQDAVLASYNGKSFDAPLLNARCRLAGVRDVYSRLPHIDLLYPTRRAFARRWPDCRLTTVEQKLLGLRRQGDIAGADIPQAWWNFLQRGDTRALRTVIRHNRWDLLSLAALPSALAQVHAVPGRHRADVLAIALHWSQRGEQGRAYALLQEHAGDLDPLGLLALARLHRRNRAWPSARGIWEELADDGHPEAVEALAKYHEHITRDFAAARHYAGRLPGGPEHERRRRRLADKPAARLQRTRGPQAV